MSGLDFESIGPERQTADGVAIECHKCECWITYQQTYGLMFGEIICRLCHEWTGEFYIDHPDFK